MLITVRAFKGLTVERTMQNSMYFPCITDELAIP